MAAQRLADDVKSCRLVQVVSFLVLAGRKAIFRLARNACCGVCADISKLGRASSVSCSMFETPSS